MMPGQQRSLADGVLFGALAALAIGRFAASDWSPRAIGHSLALAIVCAWSFHLSGQHRMPRAWGGLAFAMGWFWMPGVALALMASLAWLHRGQRVALGSSQGHDPADATPAPPPVAPRGGPLKEDPRPRAQEVLLADARSLLRTTLAMKIATDLGSQLRRVAAPFRSTYGEGTVPVLAIGEHGERGIYVEVPPWTEAVEAECLRWLALLRTSERENLEIEIRSEALVPELLSFYAERSLRNSFELEGLLAVRWKVEGFARENVAILKRLAENHLGTVVAEGQGGLRTVDELVLEYFSRDGHLLPSTVILFGSMVGELLISAHGGKWIVGADDLESVVVALPTAHGVADVNVFGRVVKLFARGAEDSLAAMAAAIDDILRPRPDAESGRCSESR